MVKLPRRRRAPDPSRPGTVYRSRPSFARSRPLSSGPPYLDPPDGSPDSPGSPADVYDQHGGAAPDPYGQRADAYAGGRDRAGRPGNVLAPERPPTQPPAPARRRVSPRLVVPLVVLALVLYPLLLALTAWTHLNRVDAISPAHAVADPGDQPGRTFLVVGSDSRKGLSKAERKRLHTGGDFGARTDTIMLLHVPSGGGPTVLVSVPRDSYVPIPGHGSNKINAAYAFGGPPLLVRTVEADTGLRVDEYVETGLGGFADIVDAIGGVRLCPKFAMKDKDAHLNVKKGCQPMDGRTALGYARARHSDPRGDLGRVDRQRETLAAIAAKTLSPATLVQPWRSFPAARAGGSALTVDDGTTPVGLARFVLAMRAVSGGNGLSLTVPVSNPNLSTPAGSAVQWDRTQALNLFRALKADDTAAVAPIAKAQAKLRG